MRAAARTTPAADSRSDSAIWSAIHVTGGSANAVLGRLPYAPSKGAISGMGGATATVCSPPPSSAGCVEVTARRRSSARVADSSSWNAAARSSDSAAGENQSRIPYSRLRNPRRVPHAGSIPNPKDAVEDALSIPQSRSTSNSAGQDVADASVTNIKDVLERRLNLLVCRDKVGLLGGRSDSDREELDRSL